MQATVLDDSWSSIKFQSADPNILLLVDRCCLHYLDVRVRIKILILIVFNIIISNILWK